MIQPQVGRTSKQPLRVKKTIFLIIILVIICFGSFVVGYQMVAVTMLEHQVKAYNNLQGNAFSHYLTLATVMMPLGAILGCLASAKLQTIGENKLMLLSDAVVIVSCLLMSRDLSFINLCMSRLLVGLSCGVSSSVLPPYLISLAPLEWRGVAGSLHQLLVTIGIGFSFYLGQRLDALALLGVEGWKCYFLLPIIYATVRLVLLGIFRFNSLEGYYQGGDVAKLKQFMKLFYNRIDLDQFIALRRLTKEREDQTRTGSQGMKGNLMTVAVLLLALNQFSGINVALPYSKQLFMRVSYYNQNRANICLQVVAVVQVLGTFLGGWLVNRFGRKRVLVTGGHMTTILLFAIFLSFFLRSKAVVLLSGLIIAFVLVYAASVGVVPLLYLGEAFPNLSFITIVYWAFSAVGMVSSNLMLTHLGIGKSFFIYAVVSFVCTIILSSKMIQSSGKTRNELRNEYLYQNKDENSTIQYAAMKSNESNQLSGHIDENNSLIEIEQ